jgi:hypothetical protein
MSSANELIRNIRLHHTLQAPLMGAGAAALTDKKETP